MSDSYTSTALDKKFSTSHAFLVGIDDYQHLAALQTAVSDARKVAEVLAQQQHFKVYPPLLNANGDELSNLLEKTLQEKVGPKDRVFFYYAGHGIADDSDEGPAGYILPVDADPANKKTFIPMEIFHKAITRLECRHVLLVLDCCFSGAFKWSDGTRAGGVFRPKKLYKERFDRFITDPAWQVITSASYDQKALDMLLGKPGDRGVDDRNREHSPFALALMDGLAGKADVKDGEEGDGVITATELYSYIRDRVEPATIKASEKKRQTPGFFPLGKHDKGEFVFLHPTHRLNLPPVPDQNPYKGLKSYNESDRELFYGRDQVVKDLQAKIPGNRLMVITGPSGSGKSSVIKAGLLPRLRDDGFRILPVVRPGNAPIETLEEVLLQSGVTQAPKSLDKGIRADLLKAFSEKPTVLLIDQYEELITRCADKDERDQYVAALRELLDKTGEDDLKIILTLRSDFEPQLDKGYLGEYWQSGRFNVPPFSAEDLKEVVAMPAIQASFVFEPPQLVDKIVEEVLQAPGALPLLSYTMSELYETYVQRSGGSKFRNFNEKDYQKLGGVRGALRSKADRLYEQFDDALKITLRNLFLRMVSIEGGEVTSRRVMVDELVYADAAENKRVEKAIADLVDSRLIVSGTSEESSEKYIEPAHDALMRAWGTLYEWMNTFGNDTIHLQRRLNQRVIDYLAHRQKHEGESAGDGVDPRTGESLLWENDPRLDQLKNVLESESNWLNKRETDFVEASLARRADIIARIEKEREELATRLSRNYIINAQTAREKGNLLQSAHYLSRSGEVMAQIGKTAFQQNFNLHNFPHLNLQLTNILNHEDSGEFQLNADSSRMLSVGKNTVYLWQISENKPLAILKHRNLKEAYFVCNDTFVLTRDSQHLRLWRAEDGKPIGKQMRYKGEHLNLDFSGDGAVLKLRASGDGESGWEVNIYAWDVKSGDVVYSKQEGEGYFVLNEDIYRETDGLTVRLWDALSGETTEIVHEAIGEDGGDIRSLTIRRRAGVLISCMRGDFIPNVDGYEGRYMIHFQLWNFEKKKLLAHWKLMDLQGDACFNDDGSLVLSWFKAAGKMQLRQTKNGKLLAELDHEGEIKSMNHRFSKDGKRLVTSTDNGLVGIWDSTQPKNSKIIQPPGDMLHVLVTEFNYDGSLLLIGYDNGIVRLWDFQTGGEVASVQHLYNEVRSKEMVTADGRGVWEKPGNVEQAFFCRDDYDSLILSCGANTAILWDRWGKIVARLHHSAEVTEAQFYQQTDETSEARANPDTYWSGKFFEDNECVRILTLADEVARVWDAKTGNQCGMIVDTKSVRFLPAQTAILSKHNDGTLRLWEMRPSDPVYLPHSGSLSASSEHSRLLLAKSTGALTELKVANGKHQAKTLALNENPQIEALNEAVDRSNDHMRSYGIEDLAVNGSVYNRDCSRILTWSDRQALAHLWDAADGRLLLETRHTLKQSHRNPGVVFFQPAVSYLKRDVFVEIGPAFNAQGTIVLTGTEGGNGSIRLWDACGGKRIATLKHSNLAGAKFTADGERIVSWGGTTLRVWSVAEGAQIEKHRLSGDYSDPVFNHDASVILSHSEHKKMLYLWMQVNGKTECFQRAEAEHTAPIMSNDGTCFVFNGNLCRTEDFKAGGAPCALLMSGGGRNDMLFSNDDTLILGWSGDRLRLWQSSDGAPAAPPMKHTANIRGALLSPDNKLILSWTDDYAVNLWHTKDGTPAAAPFKYDRMNTKIAGAVFNREQSRIYVWSTEENLQTLNIRADLDFPGEHLPRLVEASTGTTMDDHGILQLIPAGEWEKRRDEYETLEKELGNLS